MRHTFVDNFVNTVNRRFNKLLAPRLVHSSVENCGSAAKLLKKFRAHDAMRVIKSWVNSWATSDRYHEPVILPCLFGCVGAVDILDH